MPESRETAPSASRETAPSAERNKQPILEVLSRVLPPTGLVLEIGSGTGQHVAHFARKLPGLTFQPSELDEQRHASIGAWTRHENLANVKAPLAFDVTHRPWPVSAADAVVCINMIHISPWDATVALMRGAGEILKPGGVLVTYGPYRREGRHTAASNEVFDASLKARDPRWGVRDMESLAAIAKDSKLILEETVAMRANNFALVFRKGK
jgi:SAM-dependent methyltransferase